MPWPSHEGLGWRPVDPAAIRGGPRTKSIQIEHAAAGLFLIHLVLLFLPPLPPDIKGSLWDYATGYLAVLLAAVAAGRRADEIIAGWSRLTPARRWTMGLGTAGAVAGLATALALVSPTLALRWAREEGMWEPLTLLCFLGTMLALGGAARGASGRSRRHLRFLSSLYGVLALEEIDYFGVFGGVIGRIEGVYTGSLHDILSLAAHGLLTPIAVGVLLAAAAAAGLALWRLDYLQAREWLRLAASTEVVWLLAGFALLLTAAAFDARLPAFHQDLSLEEPFELAGTVCLAAFGLNRADAGRIGRQA